MDGWVDSWVDGTSFLVPVLGEMVFIIIRMISAGWNQSASEKQDELVERPLTQWLKCWGTKWKSINIHYLIN